MSSITRLFGFDYGHRVLGHAGRCASLHGHRGAVEITVGANSLNDLGMVIDFGKVKEVVGGWIDQNWDHRMILKMDDPILDLPVLSWPKIFGPRRPFVLPYNPTAENLGRLLYEKSVELLTPYGVQVLSVRFWETPNSFADYPGTSTVPVPQPEVSDPQNVSGHP